MIPTTLPRKFAYPLRFTFLLALWMLALSWIITIAQLWYGAGWYYFANGGVKFGDIYKHYAAAHFAATDDWSDLYSHTQFLDHERNDRRSLTTEALRHTPHPPSEVPSPIPKFEDHFYVYPPLIARIGSWFTGFDYFTWPNAWCILSVLFYTAAYFILRFTQTELKLSEPVRTACFFAMPSFFVTLWIVQNSTLSLLLIIWAAARLNRGRDIEAAAILSALFYKPQILLFIFIFMIAAGRLRFAIALAVTSALWLLAGIALCGLQAHQLWISILGEKFHLHRFENYYMGISPISFYTWFHPNADAPPWLNPLLTGAGFLIAAGLGRSMRSIAAKQNWKPAYLLYLAVALWVVASPVVFFYDWLLTLPWFYVVGATFKSRLGQYALLSAYVLLSNCLHLTVSSLYFMPPIGSMLCAPWLALSIFAVLREKFPRSGWR